MANENNWETVDTVGLTAIVRGCFIQGGNGDLSPNERKEFSFIGKRLRGCLMNLLTARFIAGTQILLEANEQIRQANTELAAFQAHLEQTVAILTRLNGLAALLDELLKAAVAFA